MLGCRRITVIQKPGDQKENVFPYTVVYPRGFEIISFEQRSRMASCKLQVPVVNVKTRAEFETLVHCNRKPAVLRGFDLGAAPQLWTTNYLSDTCGDIPVKVHVSPTNKMDFISKNFAYKYAQVY